MSNRRTVATAASVLAVVGCGAVVVTVALRMPAGVPAADPVAAASSSATSSAPSAAPTYAVPSAAPPDVPPVVVPSSIAPSSARVAAPTTSAARAVTTGPSPTPAPASRPATRPATGPVTKPAVVRGGDLPLNLPTSNATRVITVTASSQTSTTATVQAWTRATGGGWLRYGSAVPAHIGSQGMTPHPSEYVSATPMGSFTLTQAFGIDANPRTALPYFRVGPDDYWVSDPKASCYNTHQVLGRTRCSFDTRRGEHLLGAGYVYSYAVNIDYNRSPVVSGAGSAFFLHVTDGSATAGCVAIPEARLVTLMQWLSPAAHPRILIGTA